MSLNSRADFPDQTRHSILRRILDPTDEAQAHLARNELCSQYWEPLYACARRRGLDHSEAQDCVQEVLFSLTVKAQDQLSSQKPFRECVDGIVKLRVILLRKLLDHIFNRNRSNKRLKRGGEIKHISYDLDHIEQALAKGDLCEFDLKYFDCKWAHTVLKIAEDRLRRQEEGKLKGDQFGAVWPIVSGVQKDYDAVSVRLGQKNDTTRQQVKRLRERYKDILIAEIAQTLLNENGEEPTNSQITEELRYLWSAACTSVD
jgi:DNA-directed RNA polymerase specialized sigma24 family protein